MTSMSPPTVGRLLVACAVAFAVALFLPYWATLDGPDTKYVGGTAGVYTLAGTHRTWDYLTDGHGDAAAPSYLAAARGMLLVLGPVCLVSMLASAYGAFRRRAPSSRWARGVVTAALAFAIGFLLAIIGWGSSPHVAGPIAIAALAVARAVLGRVPVRAELYSGLPAPGLAGPHGSHVSR